MKLNYSFLKDELAVLEIRKHQWIESQKQSQELGFATAAVDWINKYGQAWKQFRLGDPLTPNPFAEKREYRRFNHSVPLELKIGDQSIQSTTHTISLVGFSCQIPQFIPTDTTTEVTISLSQEDRTGFRFQSRVVRVTPTPQGTSHFNIFVPFSENARNYIRVHPKIFGSSQNN
ncbi:MAG: hypothetical protein A2787_07845 [Omnitrophica WOR_2 bacterium RIFCSPHIGHO2_01_FULL_48_9]|nr:MAG: hypothetical protein A2787_07845 [Omnitrophica WOR_2 bacterium RIFCSPHIGHO2_01_FULL_48_9]